MPKSKLGWNFPVNDDGQENGLNDPGIETFRDHPLTSLAREILQNSSDASDESRKPVTVHFQKLEIPTSEFPGCAEFKKTLQACCEYWKGSKSTEKFFKNAISVMSKSSLSILKISDFNTTGLTVGAENDRTSDWFKLTKSVGASDKNAGKLGSFGIGKHAPFACSNLRTVFYGTLDRSGATAVQGVAKLVTHKGKGGKSTHGTGYYGITDGNRPILDFSAVPHFFERRKTGADIYIMGFHDYPDWEARITKSVIESFFVAIHSNRLIVKVGQTLVNATSLEKLIAKHYAEPDAEFFADEYYRAFTSDESVIYKEEDFGGYGQIELRLLENKEFKKKVAMFRRSGMKIFDKRFQTPARFAAVFTAEGVKLDTLLRSLEPPSHNAWEHERADDPREAKRVLNDLYAWIRDKVRQLVPDNQMQELDAEGMSQYLPDEVEEADKGAQQDSEDATHTPAPVIDMRVRSTPRPSAPDYETASGVNDLDGDSPGLGEGEGDGGGGHDGHGDGNSGDGDSDGAGQGGGAGGAGSDGGSNSDVDAPKRVELTNLRVYCSDPASGRYRILFEPKSGDASYVRLFVIGEVGTDLAQIARYSVNGGPEIAVNVKGTIGPLTVKKGERASLDVVLENSLRCALAVNAYAN